jgi:hypothetical protein
MNHYFRLATHRRRDLNLTIIVKHDVFPNEAQNLTLFDILGFPTERHGLIFSGLRFVLQHTRTRFDYFLPQQQRFLQSRGTRHHKWFEF